MALNWFAPPVLVTTLLAQYVVRYRSKSRRVKQLRLGDHANAWSCSGSARVDNAVLVFDGPAMDFGKRGANTI
jgi:hypothetical protein